ncbi:QueT transporter family protein [Pseudonocardia acaciae]|uniref:QueT transporter family protein n=1 Tax=Pseudonocardia acaciae TaxID=551276 RepID=UPI000685D146|nr:QueT transporter family protein [Pseudonocardia acaciae]
MNDILTMWRYPKMVAITALSAALYAAVLIPFKGIMILPHIDMRIATAMVPAMGIMFGPAGAFGAAIGNLIGDFFGGITLASTFGMISNFFFAYVPYKVWYATRGDNSPRTDSPRKLLKYVAASLAAMLAEISILCTGVAGVTQSLPYTVLPPVLAITNGLVPLVLGGALIQLFGPRLEKWGLLFTQIMSPDDVPRRRRTNMLGVLLIVAGSAASIIGGLYMSLVVGVQVGPPLLSITGPFLLIFLLGHVLVGIDRKEFEDWALDESDEDLDDMDSARSHADATREEEES